MSDNETSLDIVIRTRAELEGAQSVEAQLDRDIEKARELGREYSAPGEGGLQPTSASQREILSPGITESEPQTTGLEAGASATPIGSGVAAIPQSQESQAFDARAVELQADAIREAGENMRAALEQNGQTTLALLSRTLELIGEQTRKLEDVDRQLGQLAGRVKGLKNP